MRVLLLSLLVLFTLPALVRADDAPEPFKSLAGSWRRPFGLLGERDDVIPELRIAAPGDPVFRLWDGKHPAAALLEDRLLGKARSWGLIIGGGPPMSFRTVLSEQFARYELLPGNANNEFFIKVDGKIGRLLFERDKNTLTIKRKDHLPAGRYMKSYNISGAWERLRMADDE